MLQRVFAVLAIAIRGTAAGLLTPTGRPGLVATTGAQVAPVHASRTAYAWFRRFPAGLPGACGMFANLLSLGAKER